MDSLEKGGRKSRKRQGLDALKDFKFPGGEAPRAHSLSSAATHEGTPEKERAADESVDHAFEQMAQAAKDKRDLDAVYEHVLQGLETDEVDRFNDRLRTEGSAHGITITGQAEQVDQQPPEIAATEEQPPAPESGAKATEREHRRGDEPYTGDELESAHGALRSRLAALPLEADHSENISNRIEAANDPLRVRTIAQELDRLEQIHKPPASAEVEKPVRRARPTQAERKAKKAERYASEQLSDAQANLARRLGALGHLDETARTALNERIEGAKKSDEVQKLSRELGHLEKLDGLAQRLDTLAHDAPAPEPSRELAEIRETLPGEEQKPEKDKKATKKKKALKEKVPEKEKEPEKLFHDDIKKATGVSHEELLRRLKERAGGGIWKREPPADTPLFPGIELGQRDKTLKEIFANQREHALFLGSFLPSRDGMAIGLVEALSSGTLLTPEQDAWLEKNRVAFNMRRAEVDRVRELLLTDKEMEIIMRKDPRIEQVIGKIGFKEASAILVEQFEELSLTDDAAFRSMVRTLQDLKVAKEDGRVERANKEVEHALAHFGVSKDSYDAAVAQGESWETKQRLDAAAKQQFGLFKKAVDYVSGGALSHRAGRRLFMAMQGTERVRKEIDGHLSAVAHTLHGTLDPRTRMRIQRMMLSEAEPKKSEYAVESLADYKKAKESQGEKARQSRWDAFKKEHMKNAVGDDALESLKESFSNEEIRTQRRYRGRGWLSALLGLILPSKERIKSTLH